MSHPEFDMDCLYCQERLHCPEGIAGKRIRCPKCGSAMMADPGRKSDASVNLPDYVPEQTTDEQDDTTI